MVREDAKRQLFRQLEEEVVHRLSAEAAEPVLQFSRLYFETFDPEDLSGRTLGDLVGSLLGTWQFLETGGQERRRVRVINPDYPRHGWQCPHTVVAVRCPDMPFVVDSVRGELNRRGIAVHVVHSVVLQVQRNREGALLHFGRPADKLPRLPKGGSRGKEALVYLEVTRHTDQTLIDNLRATLEEILDEVSCVVSAFAALSGQASELAERLAPGEAHDQEIAAFLRWMVEGHFTFLGYERLQVDAHSTDEIRIQRDEGSCLGLLCQRPSFGQVDLYSQLEQGGTLERLSLTRSSVRSRIHRTVYPYYVGLREWNEAGQLVTEHRFLGLFTARVYSLSPTRIPLIRGKVAAVIARSGFSAEGHDGSELARLLDVFPRDELFLSRHDELFETAMAVHRIQERRRIRLFLRRDSLGKFVTATVYLPRDIYNTDLRGRVQAILEEALGAQESEFTTYFSESILTRTHFVLRVDPLNPLNVDVQDLERAIVQVATSWSEQLQQCLLDEFGEEMGTQLARNYERAFPAGYRESYDARAAVNDIREILQLQGEADIGLGLYRRIGDSHNQARFRLFHQDQPLALSDVMPMLETMGMRVLAERPHEISPRQGPRVWVHEFTLQYGHAHAIEISEVRELFLEGFRRIWCGDAEGDDFNILLTGAQLDWRSVVVLRAYARYLKQIRFNFSSRFIAGTLSRHLAITRLLVELFEQRFDPQRALSSEARESAQLERVAAIESALEQVDNLNEDRIIRQYVALIRATLRTNYFQRDEQGQPKPYLSFKLNPRAIPDLPKPVPAYEIFVYSPRVEGVHLRGGKVARGGLRWSDRLQDFRTEVLGLVKAQQVKNAVIVPVGAKGGFVVKKPPHKGGREALQQEGIACYRLFIQGLLDLTDNLGEQGVIAPPQLVRHDEDDPYLVVAADKGTATFSDIANELSLRYGFWLGDAFASGGSVGYDHKKMGITARGAWVSVQRHFRELGIDVQRESITVVGIGDMSGDVFGNGLLRSPCVQLVAAFNHQDIFIDPNPDPERSFAERQRLFELPRSSWGDYNRELISAGGGVFSRSAKSIAISEPMRERFGIRAERLPPNELISALLRAPVDLIWNGGIGTYVKSSRESHADVGDKANDALRVDACELRARVIGEGGNLGLTQLARVEYALHGGVSYTDFIDNAAGVDCSDHEVNIKILLGEVMRAGDMTEKQRRQLLESMTDEVAERVLSNNYRQTQAISLAANQVSSRLGEYRRLISRLESEGRLDRKLEYLPDEEQLQERKTLGVGLTRPELSVLISYVKGQLKESLNDDRIVGDPLLAQALLNAFPPRLCEQFAEPLSHHRLRREIIATQVANDMVNHMGITFVTRLQQSTGASQAEIALAYWTAASVFDLHSLWREVEALDMQISSARQMELMTELMRLVRRGACWFIRNRRVNLEPSVEVRQFAPAVRILADQLPSLIAGEFATVFNERYQVLLADGVPDRLAVTTASPAALYASLAITEVANSTSAAVNDAAEAYFRLGERLGLDWFQRLVVDFKVDNHWQALAREAFLDDLEWQQRTLCAAVLSHREDEDDAIDAAIDRWAQKHGVLLDRWQSMIGELRATEAPEIAMLSVAVRELLDLAQSSRYDLPMCQIS